MTRWLRGRAGAWLAASQASRGGSSCWTEEEQREELREPPRDTAGRMHRLNRCWSSVAFQGEAVWKGSLKILTTRVIEQCSLLKRAGKLGDKEGPGWDAAPNDTHPSGPFLPVRLHQPVSWSPRKCISSWRSDFQHMSLTWRRKVWIQSGLSCVLKMPLPFDLLTVCLLTFWMKIRFLKHY